MSRPSSKKTNRRRKRVAATRAKDVRRLSDFGIRNSLGQFWPAKEGPHSIAVDCGGCGTTFSVPSGAYTGGTGGDPYEITWSAGPCPRCYSSRRVKVFGKPHMQVAVDDPDDPAFWAIAGSQELAEASLCEFGDWWRASIVPPEVVVEEMAAEYASEPFIELNPADVVGLRDEGRFVVMEPSRPSRRGRKRDVPSAWFAEDVRGARMPPTFDPDEKPWPRGGPRIEAGIERLGALGAALNNWYGHVDGYEDDFLWCQCVDCERPFQFWGQVYMQFPEGADFENEVDVSRAIAFGPCTHCGSVGRPIEQLMKMTENGVTTVSSSELYWTSPFFAAIVQALEDGSLDVEAASRIFRDDGRPIYTRIADWIDWRGGTSSVTAQMLVGVLM